MSIGEEEIIELFRRELERPVKGYSRIGDDVAYLRVEGEEGYWVMKCDMLVESTDVPKGMGWELAARKSVVMTVSDFAAKGVRPLVALLSLAIPRGSDDGAIRSLAQGFKRAAQEYSLRILGGDTNEGKELVIDCCLFGRSKGIVRREGARPGDLVAVSGPFGYTSLGLKALQEGLALPQRIRERAIETVLIPKARLELGVALREADALSSCIDSSDGLALSLHQLSEASSRPFLLKELPTTQEIRRCASRMGLSIEELVLYGGEEYELVCTIKKDRLKEALRVADAQGCELIVIGEVLRGRRSGVVMEEGGRRWEVPRRGWRHLSRPLLGPNLGSAS